ncbi:MAG: riboflavin synthase [Deltaproteobacteria bacterium]|nr:riboflavin synthase [Deltaproteobacteria bacterium]
MFTGLIEGVGEITGIVRQAEGVRLGLAPPFPVAELVLGESVAVSGACLTVVAAAGGVFQVEVSPETLARTTLGLKKVRERVNLERALRLGDRLGGHLVTGHVDGVGAVRERKEGPAHIILGFEMPPGLAPYVVEKGSIAVEGVSLTVNTCEGNRFTVNLIPFTARKTTLASLRVGDRVNLETDLIGKYVAKLLQKDRQGGRGLSQDLLARHGFL